MKNFKVQYGDGKIEEYRSESIEALTETLIDGLKLIRAIVKKREQVTITIENKKVVMLLKSGEIQTGTIHHQEEEKERELKAYENSIEFPKCSQCHIDLLSHQETEQRHLNGLYCSDCE